jgi:3-oxoacyl-[acyl-carrier-protein] synthase-3
MNELGIAGIGLYNAPEFVSTFAMGTHLSADPTFIQSKLGFQTLARKHLNQETSDLCIEAYENLRNDFTIDPAEIECIVVVTQNPDAHGIPHVSALVHQKLGLKSNVACFDVSLGCSGFVHGLAIIRGFMQAHGMKSGLLFTADPYSKIIDPEDRNTALLFGDGAACMWLSDKPFYTPGRTLFRMSSETAYAISVAQKHEKLKMDGNQVFRFACKAVPSQILDLMCAEGMSNDDVDLFLVHQGSLFIVNTLRQTLHINEDKMPFEASSIGNTVSSSIPYMLKNRLVNGPSRILLAGFGVGLASAVSLLHRTQS